MLTYNWLKEDPQTRDPLLRFNWASLMTDDSVPVSVKQELKDIEHEGIPYNDAYLYWHQDMVMKHMLDMIHPDIQYDTCVWESDIPIHLYSIIQHAVGEPTYEYTKDTCFKIMLLLNICTAHIKLTFNEVKEVVKAGVYELQNKNDLYRLHARRDDPSNILYQLILKVLTGIESTRVFGDTVMLKMCELSLIRSIRDMNQFNRVSNMLRDVDFDGVKFKSINAIERKHDERTEHEVQKLMSVHADTKYVYTAELEQIVKDCGMLLPVGPSALVIRGKQHSNCVATYDQTHSDTINWKDDVIERNISRLFFDKDGTLELQITHMYGLITSTQIRQYKGRYNKDIDDKRMVNRLRIALTGKPISIMAVKKAETKTEVKNG